MNEPHYLCKSRHFWQPDWCAQDFFLTSPNAHTVFYATIGSLTQLGSFEFAAVIGRVLTTLLLAWGWVHCLTPLFFTRWAPLWSAWLYLAFAACGNFSGEWLVGGIEGKVLCYAFLLASLGEILRSRPLRAATWAGLAVSFHPVVGIWGVLAFALSEALRRILQARHTRRQRVLSKAMETDATRDVPAMPPINSPSNLSFLIAGLGPIVVFLALALPGLIPVFQLLTESVSTETRYAATYLQVFFRLAHHLDPMMFSVRSYICYALMLTLWLVSFYWGGRTNSKRIFDGIVLFAVLFAVAGIFIGWGPRPPKLMPFFAQRMQLLKFYPFRLADVLLPVALAVSLVSVLERSLFNSVRRDGLRSFGFRPEWLIALIFLAGLGRAHLTSETNRYSREDRVDWLDVCSWIDQHLPADALVQSPTNGWAFKWFARRAEYVSFKDCPQDAAGIVEWNRRLNFLQKWFEQNYADEIYSKDELRELRRLTSLSHLLTDRLGPLELEPIYRNGTFQVYDLQTLD